MAQYQQTDSPRMEPQEVMGPPAVKMDYQQVLQSQVRPVPHFQTSFLGPKMRLEVAPVLVDLDPVPVPPLALPELLPKKNATATVSVTWARQEWADWLAPFLFPALAHWAEEVEGSEGPSM